MPTAAGTPTVSVCVVVRDRLVEMERCLDRLLAQTVPPLEIVVGVSGHSTQPVAARLRERAASAPVPVHVFEDDGSVSRRRNLVAGRATGDVLAWTDSDCDPEPTWVERGVLGFADPGVGIVQGRTVAQEVAPPPGLRGTWASTLDVPTYSGLFETCNLFVRATAFAQTRGFSEEIGFWGEDTLLGWDVVTAGWRTTFAPDAVVHHDTTYPGFLAVLRRLHLYQHWAIVLRESPAARAELPYSRLFLRERDRLIALGALGLLVGVRWRPALLLLLPWLRLRRPHRLDGPEVLHSAQLLAHDGTSFLWTVVGAVKARFPLL